MSEFDGPVVVATDEQGAVAIDCDRWRTLAENSLRHEGVVSGELDLLFVDESTMTELNSQHMGKHGPTDVLSFPLDGGGGATVGEALIGSVVVCPAYAARRAPERAGVDHHRGTVDDELALLVVHGVLHVLGWDHVVDHEAERMQAREQQLLGRFLR